MTVGEMHLRIIRSILLTNTVRTFRQVAHNKIYKLERILILEGDLKSASNLNDSFYKISFFV